MGEGAHEDPSPLVLVVEDNQDLAEVYEIVLGLRGYRVATASNGRMGLELVRRLAPDVVVLDMMMPVLDGLGFLEALPQHADPPPPVVASSGFGDFETPARALGARAFLKKPVPRDELFATLDCLLAGREEAKPSLTQKARIAAQRERADVARAELWTQVDLEEPQLRGNVEALAAWLVHYLGFGKALVDLMCGDRIYVYVGSDQPGKHMVERPLAFCSDVVDAGSSLLIADTTSHPVFADHQAVSYWNTRFYAGCPITVRSGVVAGTLCVVDAVPRELDVVDMRLLEHLAGRIGALLEANAERRPLTSPILEPPALFDRAILEAVVATRLAERAAMELIVAAFWPIDARLARAAAVVHDATAGMRVLSAQPGPGTLAIFCDGPNPSAGRARALEALRRSSCGQKAIGIATYRPALARHAPSKEDKLHADRFIAAAEAACARSAARGGAEVEEAIGEWLWPEHPRSAPA